MSNFTPTKCYILADVQITFDKKGIIIKDNSGTTLETRKFYDGFEIMIHNGDFCFGEITFRRSFDKTIDLDDAASGVIFDEPNERVIGADVAGDPGIAAHLYSINLCPIRLKSDDGDILTFTCPCDGEEDPCSNRCYEFDTWN